MKYKIKPTEEYDEMFWSGNYPVQLWKDDDGKVNFVGYMPRKEACFTSDDIPEDEVNTVIDNSIAKFETAIALFKAFKEGKIDHVYYWDEDELAEK